MPNKDSYESFLKAWLLSGEGTPILGHGKEVPQLWPPFLRLLIWLDPYFMPQHYPIDASFCRKKWFVSITFSSRDTCTYTFVINIYYLTIFKHFVSIFSLNCDPIDPFSLILDLFDPHLYKTLDPIGSMFLSHTEPGYKKIGEPPPPPHPSIFILTPCIMFSYPPVSCLKLE